MSNQRKLKRRHLIYYLRVFDAVTLQLLGHMVDVTTEGLMLVSEQPLETGRKYVMRVVLPDEILGKKEIEFETACRWCKTDVNPDFYASGFEFVTSEPDALVIVNRLIHRYGFHD